MHWTRGIGGVTRAPGRKIVLCPLRCLDAHHRTQTVAFGLDPFQFDSQPVMLVVAVVDPELGWRSKCRDHEIEAPIAVEVARHGDAVATRCDRFEAGSFGDPLEGPIPGISEHRVGLVDLDRRIDRASLDVCSRVEDVVEAVVFEIADGGRVARQVPDLRGETARPTDVLELPGLSVPH